MINFYEKMFYYDPMQSEVNTFNDLVLGREMRLANPMLSGGNALNKPNAKRENTTSKPSVK